jgi:hypothetical protein
MSGTSRYAVRSAGLRSLLLTAHVASSVGWLGAVVAFLPLAVAGAVSDDVRVSSAAYLGMDLIARHALIPLCLGSVLTGVVQSLTTPWGLLRHYWIAAKLVITIVSTVLLVTYLPMLHHLAGLAAAQLAGDMVSPHHPSPLVHAVLALLALLVATTLSVFRPWGRTPWGRRA